MAELDAREEDNLRALWHPEGPAAREVIEGRLDVGLYGENARSPPVHAGSLAELLRDEPEGAYAVRRTERGLAEAGPRPSNLLRDARDGPVRVISIDVHAGGGVVRSTPLAVDEEGRLWTIAAASWGGGHGLYVRAARVGSVDALAYEVGGRIPVAWNPDGVLRDRDRDPALPPFCHREDTLGRRSTLRLSGGYFKYLHSNGEGGRDVYRFVSAPWSIQRRRPGYIPRAGEIGERDRYGVVVSRGGLHAIFPYRDGSYFDEDPVGNLPDEPDEAEARAAAEPYSGKRVYLTPVPAGEVPEEVLCARGELESNLYVVPRVSVR